MKKLFLILLLLFLGFSLFSCRKTDNEATVLFQDNFEYAIESPWNLSTPVNGWSNTVPPNDWNIVAGGNPGNALEYLGSGLSQLANNFSGTDYKISVQFNPMNFLADSPLCLAGRINNVPNPNNCYLVCVNDNGTNVYLDIDNYDGGSLLLLASIIVPSAHPLLTGTWYTLTMTLSSNIITGDLSGGTLTETTVTVTDTTHANGKVGLLVSNINPTYDVLFDNYLVVTTP